MNANVNATADRALAAFRRLAVSRGVVLGALQSGRFFEFTVVIGAAALAFAPGRDYSEPEVNAALKAWLAGPGAMLATDHVELRRWLVDCRLLARDGFGHRYSRALASGPWGAVLDALGGIDLDAQASSAREADALQRAQRKARWEERDRLDGSSS
jgi:hypothetical protein